MEADVHGPTTAPLLRAAEPVRGRSELERLRSACRRQALVMDTLTRAVLHLRRGASALRADNAELRAENAWLRTHQRDGVRAGAEDYMGELRLPVDVHAPGASRAVIAQCLHDRLDAGALERAQLLVSELVSNSVRHSGASPDEAVRIRFELTQTALRLEVDDPGEAAVVRRREANVANGGGFGLNLVDALSARWGAEPNAGGGTRVWAQLSCAAAAQVPAPRRDAHRDGPALEDRRPSRAGGEGDPWNRTTRNGGGHANAARCLGPAGEADTERKET